MTPREFVILVLLLWALFYWSDAGACDNAHVIKHDRSDNEFVITLGAGNNTNLTGSSLPWEDGGGTGGFFRFGYEGDIDDVTLGVHWVHISQYEVGPPMNDVDESSVDHFGVYVEWRW